MLRSSVLIFDKRVPVNNDLGADVVHDLSEAKVKLQANDYSTFAMDIHLATLSDISEIATIANSKNIGANLIVIHDAKRDTHSEEILQKITNKFRIFKIIAQFNIDVLFQAVRESIEAYDFRSQNVELLQILKEQNQKLQSISKDLEDRVQQRQLGLLESKQKLLQANKYYSSILFALVAIQKSESIAEMENTILKTLSDALDITFVRIVFQTQSNAADSASRNSKKFAIFENDLVLEKRKLGKIVFARENGNRFTREEAHFLKQISDAISLALDRLLQRDQSDFLRKQWQSTFDAITEPVVLINETYEVIQSNQSFKGFINPQLQSKKCYEQFFGKKSPCSGCTLGKSFELGVSKTTGQREVQFFVESQHTHKNEDTTHPIYVNIYRDQTQQKRTERQILESSKIAELGLVGGSLAHELNNPLAGLITFIQMLKGDLSNESTNDSNEKSKELLSDLNEMEKSALRCKEIIQNLLSFSRKPDAKKEKLHLQDLINKALRVMQVKTKPLGVDIQFKSHVLDDIIYGHENPLTQSLLNILQNSVDAILEKKKTDKSIVPLIELELTKDATYFYIDVLDNGIGLGKNELIKVFTPFYTTKNPEQHRGLGLTTAYQILQDHSGDIELTRIFENLTRVRIILPV